MSVLNSSSFVGIAKFLTESVLRNFNTFSNDLLSRSMKVCPKASLGKETDLFAIFSSKDPGYFF